MRTVRSSGRISRGRVSAPGGCLLWGGSALGVRVCSQGGLLPGGVCSGGVSAPKGVFAPGGRGCVSALGGVCSWGVSAPGERGVCLLWGCLLLGGVCSQGGVCLLRGVSAPRGGGVCLLQGVSAPGRCLLPGRMQNVCLLWGGVCSQGVSAPRGVCTQNGCVCSGGYLLLEGWYRSMHWGRHPPCGQTDACKNLTFAKSVADGNNALQSIFLAIHIRILDFQLILQISWIFRCQHFTCYLWNVLLEIFKVNTKLPMLSMLASIVFTVAKMLPPVRLNLIITGSTPGMNITWICLKNNTTQLYILYYGEPTYIWIFSSIPKGGSDIHNFSNNKWALAKCKSVKPNANL